MPKRKRRLITRKNEVQKRRLYRKKKLFRTLALRISGLDQFEKIFVLDKNRLARALLRCPP